MSKSILLVLLTATLFLGACKSKKQAAGSQLQSQAINELWGKVDQQLDFETFSAKMKLRVSDSTGSQGASAQIRVAKDSLIWISLRKASIEGARVLISPDSVKIIDRQAKQYFPASYNYFEDRFGLSFSFKDLQDIIIGNVLLREEAGEELDFSQGLDADMHKLEASKDGLLHSFWIDQASFLSKMMVEEEASGRLLSVGFDAFIQLDSHNFAQERVVYLADGNGLNTTLEIDYSSVELNEELNFSFSVNSKYETIKEP